MVGWNERHYHWKIAPMPVKQPCRKWVNKPDIPNKNSQYNHNKTREKKANLIRYQSSHKRKNLQFSTNFPERTPFPEKLLDTRASFFNSGNQSTLFQDPNFPEWTPFFKICWVTEPIFEIPNTNWGHTHSIWQSVGLFTQSDNSGVRLFLVIRKDPLW